MVRSPRALMKIAETGGRAPGTRMQPPQSTPSSARPSTSRSPIASWPAGPPSGAANVTLPPRRMMATAALAAPPPPTVMNSLASTLLSGSGNSRTRNTSSRTAMPAQRMCGMSDEAPVGFDPCPDDVVGDGDGMGHHQAGGVPAQQHRGDLVAGKPARILELAVVHGDFHSHRRRMAADHQRHRERPRLRREIGDPPAHDPGLLAGLAPHRLLQGLAGLDKAGKARPHVRRKARAAAEQAILAVDRQHDDDGIGTREMLHAAGRAVAPPAGVDRLARRPAI